MEFTRRKKTTIDENGEKRDHISYSFSLGDDFWDFVMMVGVILLIVHCCGCNKSTSYSGNQDILTLMTFCNEKELKTILQQETNDYDTETVKEMVITALSDSQLNPQQQLNLLLNAYQLGFINELVFLNKLEAFNNDTDFTETLKENADRIAEQKKDANEIVGKNQPY